MTFLIIEGTGNWLSISNVFLKKQGEKTSVPWLKAHKQGWLKGKVKVLSKALSDRGFEVAKSIF